MAEPVCYIVTGGAGFVGSNCCAAISKARPDARVLCIDDFRTGSFHNLIEAYDRIAQGPVTCEVWPEDWTRAIDLLAGTWASSPGVPSPALHGPVAVVHMAAITDTTVDDQRAMLATNAGRAWEAMLRGVVKGSHRLVYASSAATYGTPPQARDRQPFPLDAAGRPENIYGFSKWAMEQAHRRVQREHPRAWIVGLRFFNVFGPGESSKGAMASMAYKLAQQMLQGQRPRLFAPGDQARDQVYVDDVVAGVLAALGLGGRRDPQPGIYNMGSGLATTFNQVADAVRAGLGLPSDQLPTEYFQMPEHIARFYQSFTQADMSQTSQALGFEPAHDPVQATRQYAQYLAQYRARRAGGPR
ncbi:MAG: ADP-L-glycero-D-manno-heptose-6-epimerase [Phycisphaerales bacterium]|nr:MAG: ADP-L-glycero-D-manno-heptose-6-epimerase [Phycisphaerales bacterium]